MKYSRKEAFVRLENYDLPFIIWGRNKTYLGCDNLIIKYNKVEFMPEVINENDESNTNEIKKSLFYYPSIVSARIVTGYEDGSVSLYPYRKRSEIVLDPHPLNGNIEMKRFLNLVASRANKLLEKRMILKGVYDSDNFILDTGRGGEIVIEKELVELFESITREKVDKLEGKVKERGMLTVMGDDFEAAIEGEVLTES